MKKRDLSLMYIPEIDATNFIDSFMFMDYDSCEKVNDFYRKNGRLSQNDTEINNYDFSKCLNLMKEEDPETFTQAYDFLREINAIPESPIITDLNLTWEQFDYIDGYERETGRRPFTVQLMLHAVRKDPSAFEDIGRTCEAISNMRFGDVEDQETYYEFCSMPAVQVLNGLIVVENSLEDRATKLVDGVEKKTSDNYIR